MCIRDRWNPTVCCAPVRSWASMMTCSRALRSTACSSCPRDVYKRQVQYCAFNMGEDHILYGGKLAVKVGIDQFLNWLDSIERAMLKAESDAGFYAPGPFKELVEKPLSLIHISVPLPPLPHWPPWPAAWC